MNEFCIGAFTGLLLGDSIGSYLEFTNEEIDENSVNKALEMTGGGHWNLGPGQITDDGELVLSLGYALINSNPFKGFPREKVFGEYHAWFKSIPFDIGYTCRIAFASDKIDEDLEISLRSQSNGALMRILPLSIWARNLNYSVIGQYAKQDAKLSHPNKICGEVNEIYSIAVAYLINNKGDREGCINFIDEYISKNIKEKEVIEWYQKSKTKNINDAKTNAGYVKYAFWMSFYHLNKGTNFIDAIKETLFAGGDTDTNCAIVGGMVGSYVGVNEIPKEMIEKILNFDPTILGRRRPLKYKPSNYIQILNAFK